MPCDPSTEHMNNRPRANKGVCTTDADPVDSEKKFFSAEARLPSAFPPRETTAVSSVEGGRSNRSGRGKPIIVPVSSKPSVSPTQYSSTQVQKNETKSMDEPWKTTQTATVHMRKSKTFVVRHRHEKQAPKKANTRKITREQTG